MFALKMRWVGGVEEVYYFQPVSHTPLITALFGNCDRYQSFFILMEFVEFLMKSILKAKLCDILKSNG